MIMRIRAKGGGGVFCLLGISHYVSPSTSRRASVLVRHTPLTVGHYNGKEAENVLYEDNHLLCVYKPAGVLSQGGMRNNDNDNALDVFKQFLKKKYEKPGNAFLGLTHRLDRRASGLLVFGKNSKASSRLSKSFSDREVLKRYICVVGGSMKRRGKCSNWLVPGSGVGGKTEIFPEHARLHGRKVWAHLEYFPLCIVGNPITGETATIVDITLGTGRKHQIRAQLSHIGYPILGDVKYGSTLRIPGLALHNYQLVVPSVTKCGNKGVGSSYVFVCDIPQTWNVFLKKYCRILAQAERFDGATVQELLNKHLSSCSNST